MDKLLWVWIEDKMQMFNPLSTVIAKAKSLFMILKVEFGPNYDVEFTGSSGWYKGFKNCYLLDNVKLSGKSGSADRKAGEEVLETLEKLIVEENYLPGKIFNMDEISIF